MLACGEREAMVMAPPPTRDSAVSPCFHGCRAFLHRHFPPWSPPLHPLDLSLYSQQQPSHWDCSTIPKLQLPAAAPFRGPAFLPSICMAAARTVWFSFHLGCHISAVSLSALNVSPLTQTIALLWIGPLLQFLHLLRVGPVLLTLLFFPLVPSSYRVLGGSIYSFPLVRSSCRLSAGVLYALLCLKVYSWCIHGKRCTPCPLTPLPSCSPAQFQSPFSLILLNPKRNRDRTRKGIKFWMEKLIINLAEKLSFRGLSFSCSICLFIIDAGGAVVLTSFRHLTYTSSFLQREFPLHE